jgi:tetratricopeptide (TPR) repeat protein
MGKKSRLKKEKRQKEAKKEKAVKAQLSSRTVILYLAILVIATLLVYWQSLGNDFVNLDDNAHVYENPNILSLEWQNIKAMFTGSVMGNWIPLTQLSFALDYHFWGMDAYGFHLSSLIIHLINVLLVFWLFWLLTRNGGISFLSALIFALHPLHVESVAWITERKDVLYAMFYLLALIFWTQRKKHFGSYYFLTLLMFALALLAKSMAVTLPLVLILYDVFYEGKALKLSLPDKLPMFLMGLSAVLITWQATYSETDTYAQLNLFERLLMADYAFLFYPFKLLLPFNLSAIYPYPQGINQALPVYYYLLPLVTAALLWLFISIKNKAASIVFWGWFYLLTILPVLQILPLAGSSITCDRFTYIPSSGVFMILILVVWRMFEPVELNQLQWKKPLKKNIVSIFVILAIVFGILSWQRTKVWKNGVTLHTDIINKHPEIELPWINRGKAYSERGEHGRAIEDFSEAIKLNPASADAYNNRGNEFGDLNQYEQGIADLTKAIELRPDFAEGFSNRAHLYQEAGLAELAEQDFDQAIELDPQYAAAWYNRANLFRQKAEYEKAVKDYSRALQINPLMADAYNNRGNAWSRAGDYKKAIDDFSRALSLEPENVSFYNNRGNAYKDSGNLQKALNDFNQAIKINPYYSNAYHNRAVVYYTMGDLEKARDDIRRVKQMGGYVNPAFEEALNQ